MKRNVKGLVIISRPDVPFIPEQITVHLGNPNETAQNITMSFPDYIKNVASSEIYPTWPESAIRANIYAQITFALNKIYTEWYRSRGYDFDITNSSQYDQSFVYGREIFENISKIVDEIFNSYIVRTGKIEPTYTPYCDGINAKCDGLYQWGTVTLAEDGYSPYDILKYYYGKIFNLNQTGIIDSATWYKIKYIYNAVKGLNDFTSEGIIPEEIESPFQVAWQEGDSGIWVKLIQYYVRVLGCYYPEIPIIEITGYFGPETTEAVKAIEKKFNLIIDGIVGIQTWSILDKEYKNIYNRIPEGCLKNKTIYPGYILSKGMGDKNVRLMQLYLEKISEHYPSIPKVNVTGLFDEQTEAAVRAIQKEFLNENTGLIGPITWSKIAELYENYYPIS